MGGACSRCGGSLDGGEIAAELGFTRNRNSIQCKLLMPTVSPSSQYQDKNPVDSLLELCVKSVIQNVHQFSSFSELPCDLSRKIFGQISANSNLSPMIISLFHDCNLKDICLSNQTLVSDLWLKLLSSHSPTLMSIDFSHCGGVSSKGILYFHNLPCLESLNLNGCSGIDNSGLKILENCPNLTRISLESSQTLTMLGLTAFCHLSSIREISLEKCPKIGGGLKHLSGLGSTLRVLNLTRCLTVDDVDVEEGITGLLELEELFLARTKVTDRGLKVIKNLKKLRKLSLAGCHVSDDGLQALTGLVELTLLDLEWCQGVTSNGLKHFKELSALKTLNLAYTRVGKWLGPLTKLHSLEDLNLDSTGVRNEDMASLAGLENLRVLDLSDTKVDETGLQHIQGLPNISCLNMSYSGLSDSGLTIIARMSSLVTVSLDSGKITDAGLASLAALKNLTELDLFGSKISDTGMIHLSGLKSLKSLEICSGFVTDIGVQRLKGLTNLTRLNLSQNWRVTDAALDSLAGMLKLRSLNLSGCSIRGPGLGKICHLSGLASLALNQCKVSRSQVQKILMSPTCRWPENLFISGLKN